MYVYQMDQRYAIMFLLKKNMKPKDIIKNLQETYKDACLSESQIYFWIREIRCGRTNLNDLPKPGRPVDEQLTVSIQRQHSNDKSASARKIARSLNVSPTTVVDHMRNRIGMKLVFLRNIPHILTEDQKIQRVKLSKVLLQNLTQEQETGFEFVLTGDECWFVHQYQLKEIWILKNEDIPVRVIDSHYTKKTMFTIFINGKGVQLIDIKPDSEKITSDYFIANVLASIEESDLMKKAKRWKHKLCLHYDNAPSHCSQKVKERNKNSFTKIWDHPPYSPDLAICDFGLFGTIKNSFTGNDFDDVDDLKNAIEHFFSSKSEDFFHSLFTCWIRRLNACISNGGNYT